MNRCFDAALKLHRYLYDNHWQGQALMGPDSGIRFNYRIGRFIKSYLRRIRWNDNYYYLQAQGYWILSNWCLFECTREERYRDIAVRCSEYMLKRQREDGAWVYPNREWKGRIATAEGTWGSLGLLETYRYTGSPEFLIGALRWHRFLLEVIGFQRADDELAINYFANFGTLRVPNNSAFVLRFLAALSDITRNRTYLGPCQGLMRFLQRVQRGTGEFPYALAGAGNREDHQHFQCYQYNAFQCLDLIRYYELTQDSAALPLISNILLFLRSGMADDGHVFYGCGHRYRHVTYHTAVVAAAFAHASHCNIGMSPEANRAYTYLLTQQRPDGSFPHSRGDYRLLQDVRSYPRNLSMILYHLLEERRD
jgi:hypothetical protein